MYRLLIILLLASNIVFGQAGFFMGVANPQSNGPVTPPDPDPELGDWFVKVPADGGNDGNAGTSPSVSFATISAAHAAASNRDVIVVYNGTYRETVVVTKTNITIRNASGNHSVYISGAEPFGDGGWTNDTGNIWYKNITMPLDGQYTTSISSNTTLLNNQIWTSDGLEKVMGTYPNLPSGNTTEGLFDRAYLDNSFSILNGTTLTDPSLPAITVVTNTFGISYGWFVATGWTATSRSGTTLTISGGHGGGGDFNKRYRLYAAKELVNQEGEWFYDASTDRLYYQTGGGPPTGLLYKARNYGVRPNGNNLTLRGIRLFGCGIDGTGANFIYDGRPSESSDSTAYSTVMYPYHGLKVGNQNSGLDVYSGFKVTGGGSEYRNLYIKYCAGTAIYGYENDNIHNNRAEYISYAGNYGAFVRPAPSQGNIRIEKNTGKYFGRSAIDLGYNDGDDHHDMTIKLNDFSYAMMLSYDGATIYGGIHLEIEGTEISYNYLHLAQALTESAGGDKGFMSSGVYFDQHVGPATIHHNIIVGISNSYENGNLFHERNNVVTASHYYNNTLLGGAQGCYITYVPFGENFDYLKNNIFRSGNNFCNGSCNAGGSSPYFTNNISSGTNPLFAGGFGADDYRNYRLQSGSPARGAATTIGGITTSNDAGAIDYGATWIPGCGF